MIDFSLNVTSQEEEQIKSAIKPRYSKYFDEKNFESDYTIFKRLPLFGTMECIYDEDNNLKPEFEGFSKSVHYIMHLVMTYHMAQAFKAAKYDILNDGNMSTDLWGNIGTPGRIAKVFVGDKLDNSIFTEFGDGRFTPTPRMAGFPVDRLDITVKKVITTLTGAMTPELNYEIETEEGKKFNVTQGLTGGHDVLFFDDMRTKQRYYLELDDRENLVKEGEKLSLIEDPEIVVKIIEQPYLGSVCSHHGLPYFIAPNNPKSKIVVAYKPYNHLMWISKLDRIVEYCGNTPSLQEGFTRKVFNVVKKAAGTEDVFVGMYDIVHTCGCTRGAKRMSGTTTEKAWGVFKDELLRQNIINS